MKLKIDYESKDFPPSYNVGSGTLSTSWDDLLWAAITVGRPNTWYFSPHSPASLSGGFSSIYNQDFEILEDKWEEILCKITSKGQPNIQRFLRYGLPSLYDALFRLSLIRMAVKRDPS